MASTKDDNQGSFASKRFRNDGSRKDGDWTCPNCGNLNFSFRNVCNRGHCGAPRPSVTPPAPVTSPYRNNHPFYYGGVEALPPPYAMSSRFGSPIPHSGVQYDYGLYARPRVPYSPIPSFPPGSYGGIPYGPTPRMNGYGFQSPQWAAEGLTTDNFASRKRRGDLYMDRWSGILRVPLHPNSRTHHRVGASLCLFPGTRTMIVPIANAIFFCGDRVEGTGNPVIERLSDLQKLSEIVVSKFGSFINAWVIEASVFNGPFAVFKDFIPSVNQYGEPRSYHPSGFPASTSTVSLLSNCLEEVKKVILGRQVDTQSGSTPSSCFSHPKTFILGFSKGGTVLNQLVTELGFADIESKANSPDVGQPTDRKFSECEEIYIVPKTKESLLNSITEIHYIDVGLNSTGAYLTNHDVFERISKRLIQGAPQVRFILHGTPRQWSDKRREWICNEKDKMLHLLESEAHKSGGKLQVYERFYFADKPPDMQMHFEIIESFDVS